MFPKDDKSELLISYITGSLTTAYLWDVSLTLEDEVRRHFPALILSFNPMLKGRACLEAGMESYQDPLSRNSIWWSRSRAVRHKYHFSAFDLTTLRSLLSYIFYDKVNRPWIDHLVLFKVVVCAGTILLCCADILLALRGMLVLRFSSLNFSQG